MKADNNSKTIKSPNPGGDKSSQLICGFWKRLFAFVIDGIILGLFGFAIGTLFFDFFAEIGGLGLLFGFVIALLYFGIQNSSVCNGQTIGKRILKIKVVDNKAKNITLQRSFARFMILGPPYFLNGVLLPPNLMNNYLLSLLLGLIVFFGLAGIIYLYIFNRNTRQSLHDLVVRTYVINSPTTKKLSFHPKALWKGHLAVLGTIFVVVIITITIVVPKLSQTEFFKELLIVQNKIMSSGLVHSVKVSAGKSFRMKSEINGERKGKNTYVSINAILKKKPSDYVMPIKKIAKIVLDNYPPIKGKDTLVVTVSYGYDIGIARAWKSQMQSHSPKEWRDLLSRPSGKSEL